MTAINLANVNISIQQFQNTSDGDYNAGKVQSPKRRAPAHAFSASPV